MFNSFKNPDTLGVISSYPAPGGEVARGNAISRYTYLLTKNFPKSQKVVVFCEIRKSKKPFLITPNILIVPTYRLNSLNFFREVLTKSLEFNAIDNILIQFEFSIFGGKVVIPQMLALITAFKLMGKKTKIMFHQVIDDINLLSGHLAIKRGGMKARALNALLKIFYKSCGVLADKIFVHDNVLAGRISGLIDKSKISIIPHAVAPEEKLSKTFSGNSKKYFGVKGDALLIGLFGYCSWYKGTDWLIENFARYVKDNPNLNIRLLVAGGESPTLKGTSAYKVYHQKLQKVIKEANGSIIYTGYLPDRDVKKVFGACDLFVFPYRTKMSASGAFSLCLGYKKPYIVSRAFSENIEKSQATSRVFSLNYESFSGLLTQKINSREKVGPFVPGKSWKEVSQIYLNESMPGATLTAKLAYAQAY